MRRDRVGIYLMTILFVATVIAFLFYDFVGGEPFYFVAETENGTEKIQVWNKGNGEGYVFVPGYVNLDEIKIQTNLPIYFHDIRMSWGVNCGRLDFDVPYILHGKTNGVESLVFVQSGGVPTMYLDTVSGSMSKIHEDKENKEFGSLRLYTSEGMLDYTGNFETLKMRGNNLSGSEKKPYNLELSTEANLLGMGKANRWILLSNAFDVSSIKNKMVLDFALEVGLKYTPECQWVDLYLNGTYAGLYLLTERNEIHPQRVNIQDKGSFLVSQDAEYRFVQKGLPYVKTEKGVALRIYSSDLDKTTLLEVFQSIENAIIAPDGVDHQTGKHFTELIDIDSWARKYLIEEIFANFDGGRLSQFYYRDGSDPAGKIYAGPAWDYDMIMWDDPNTFGVNQPGKFKVSHWFNPLYEQGVFYDYVINLYQREFLPLLIELRDYGIKQYYEEIDEAARMNDIRWRTGSPEKDMREIKAWLSKRIDFLKNVWIEEREYITVTAGFGTNSFAIYILSPGENLLELSCRDDFRWYIMGTDTLVDLAKPVYEDCKIELKAQSTVEERPDSNEMTDKSEYTVSITSSREREVWLLALLLGMFFLCLIMIDVLRTKK